METKSPMVELNGRNINIEADIKKFPLPFNLNEQIKPFNEIVRTNQSLHYFLRGTAVIWSLSGDTMVAKIMQYMWNTIVRIFLLYFIYGSFISFTNAGKKGASFEGVLFQFIFGMAFLSQSLSLIVSLNELKRRLNLKTSNFEFQNVNDGLFWSQTVLVTSLLMSGIATYGYYESEKVYGIGLKLSGGLNYSAVFMCGAQISVSLFLSANLFFILLDCSVASKLIDQLTELLSKNELQITHYNLVRDEIKSRVTNNTWLTYSLVVVAFLNTLAVLFLMLVTDLFTNIDMALMMLLFLKEFPFLIISVLHSAQVNEKSDALTKQLGCNTWDLENVNECHKRTALYINAESSRISFPLAGKRMNYNDITRQLIAWLIALVFGILKMVAASF
jgi:hypothetical protein